MADPQVHHQTSHQSYVPLKLEGFLHQEDMEAIREQICRAHTFATYIILEVTIQTTWLVLDSEYEQVCLSFQQYFPGLSKKETRAHYQGAAEQSYQEFQCGSQASRWRVAAGSRASSYCPPSRWPPAQTAQTGAWPCPRLPVASGAPHACPWQRGSSHPTKLW